MNRLTKLTAKLTLLAIVLLGTSTLVFGQGVTSAALDGTVRNPAGDPVAGATVTVTHVPSGTVYRTTTRSSGYYGVTGLRVGGPYTVTVRTDTYATTSVEGVYVELGRAQQVPVTLASPDDIQELEEFVVTGDDISILFNANTTGASSTLTNEAVEGNPQFRRSLNDFARFNPYAAITENDRNELTVAGQNSRFNNVQIDGIRTNDQFGLNSNGVASFNNPVASDAIEQITVEVSPYDVRQSGFTGGSINAVTKSGTNQFSGSLYTYYTDDKLRGDDVRDGDNPLFREFTWGGTLGGPIIRDKLFFFVNYEEFERTEVAGSPGFIPDSAAIQQVIDYGNNVLGLDFGSFEAPDAAVETDEKILAKLDWNITEDHRFNITYRSTEGVNPNFGNFDDFRETALTSNFYRQLRDEESWVGQLFSTWTPDFQTELRVAYSEFRQPTTFDTALPQIEIDEFPGADGDPDAGELFFGTERFRHANNLEWDTLQIAAVGTYYKDDFEITFGFDMEATDYRNLFLESSFGNFTFATLDDFLNDVPQFDGFRNTAIEGQNPVAEPDIAVMGAFLQNKWTVNRRLTLTGGLRVDWVSSDSVPPVAQGFEDAFGFPNNGTPDGETLVAPRFGFNYALNEDRTMQLRGGIGLFLGRSPAVWFSNVFTNNGETTGRIDLENGLVDFVQNDFDPANPIVSIPREDSTPVVDAAEQGIQLPSVWRYNVAFDWELPGDFIFTAEALVTDVEEALWVENINQPVIAQGPDGRQIYDDGGASSEFRDVFVLRNTDTGKAENFTLQIQKPARDNGFFGSFSWTYGKSTEVNPFTSSRAVSNWNNRAGFNFNEPEEGTSNFEVRNRFLGVFGYTSEWREGFRTTATLVYEGRTGRPFSYVFDADINGSGEDDTDLLYVPTGPSDPLVSFDPAFPVDDFFSYLDRTGLSQYAGGPAPRNAFNGPWVHTWDLKVVQELPIWDRVYSEIFFDFRNIGNWIDDEWGLVREAGFPFTIEAAEAEIVGNQFNFTEFSGGEPTIRTGRYRSRWAFQVGAKLKF